MTTTMPPTSTAAQPRALLDRLLDLTDLGIDPSSVSPDEMRRIRILSISILSMLPVGAVYFANHFFLGTYGMCLMLVLTLGLAVADLALLRATLNPTLGAHIGIALLGTVLIYSNYTSGGFYEPNFSWLYLLPICAAIVLDKWGTVAWTLITVAITGIFWGLPHFGFEIQSQIPEPYREAQALFHRITAIATGALIATSFVTAQRRAERSLAQTNDDLFLETAYVQILQHAAEAANEAVSFEGAMHESVGRICSAMGWTVGHVWLVQEDHSISSSGLTHNAEPDRFGALQQMSTQAIYHPGEGLAGRAVSSGQPQSILDLGAEGPYGRRAQLAAAAGLRSAFAVPVPVSGEVRAVLEFASTQTLTQDERLIEVFSHIGIQLGRVAERASLQDRLRQSQKMEAVGQLAAGLAHEINNPMSYARSNLHLLRQDWSELRSKLGQTDSQEQERLAECEELISDALEGIERTIAIVRDVREFSHFGGGGGGSWVQTDLIDLIEGALRVASTQSSPDIEFERNYQKTPPVACAHNQLRQVFVNLLVNAVQALGDKGTIRLSTAVENDEVVALVEDDGPGMTPETLERLFDPFFTTKPVGEGTGLGLYVSYEIIKSHGGRIVVSSDPGSGTRFEVRLPTKITPDSSAEG